MVPTFAELGPRAEKPSADLGLADLETDPVRRRSLAEQAQALLFDAPEDPGDAYLLIPLVRAHAFLATTAEWAGLEAREGSLEIDHERETP